MLVENAMWLYGTLLKLQQKGIVSYIYADDIYNPKRNPELDNFGSHIEMDISFTGRDELYFLFACENGFKLGDWLQDRVVDKDTVIKFLGRKARRVV